MSGWLWGLCVVVVAVRGELLGEYYWIDKSENSGLKLKHQFYDQNIQNVTFNFGDSSVGGWPGNYGLVNNFVWVEWNGSIATSVSNNYFLHYGVNDGLQVYLDDNPLDAIKSGENGYFAFPLTAGQSYSIKIRFVQFYGGSYLTLQFNDSNCCSFSSPEVTILTFDPTSTPPILQRNDSILNFTITDSPFNMEGVVKWSGYLVPPLQFSNQWMTLEVLCSDGFAFYLNQELLVDQFWRDMSFNSFDLFTYPGTVFPITIKSWRSTSGGFFQLNWGLTNSTERSIVPSSAFTLVKPTMDVEGDVNVSGNVLSGSLNILKNTNLQVQGNLQLENLFVSFSSTITVQGNLTILGQLHLSGLLFVDGYLSASSILISTSLNSIEAPLVLTRCFNESSSDLNITLRMNNTSLEPNTYYPIISYDCLDSFLPSIHLEFPMRSETRDNTWDCQGGKYTYLALKSKSSLGLFVNSDGECGIGVKVVSGVGGAILGITLILAVFLVYKNIQKFNNLDKKIASIFKGVQ